MDRRSFGIQRMLEDFSIKYSFIENGNQHYLGCVSLDGSNVNFMKFVPARSENSHIQKLIEVVKERYEEIVHI